MGIQLWADNAITTLAAPITATSTSLSVVSGSGSLFPAIAAGSGNWFVATLQKINTGVSPPVVTAQEVIRVNANSGDTFTTIVRAQEMTTAISFNAGDSCSLFATAGGLKNFVQPAQAQAQTWNWSLDTGTANAYVVGLTPALSAHVPYMPISVGTLHANTGASTLNDGAGVLPIILPNGQPLQGGEIAPPLGGGTIFTVFNNGAGSFQLMSGNWITYANLLTALAAQATGVGAVIPGLVINNVAVSTSYQTVCQFPVVPNATYGITFDGTCAGSSGVGNLSTQVVPDTGTITAQNAGSNSNLNFGSSAATFKFGNLAGGGGGYPLSGWPLYQNSTQQLHLQGEFKTGSAAINYAYLQFIVTAGILTVGGGSYGNLLRIV